MPRPTFSAFRRVFVTLLAALALMALSMTSAEAAPTATASSPVATNGSSVHPTATRSTAAPRNASTASVAQAVSPPLVSGTHVEPAGPQGPAVPPPSSGAVRVPPPAVQAHGVHPLDSTTYTDFVGLNQNQSGGSAPPDPNGAAGINDLVQVVNSQLTFDNFNAGQLYTTSLQNWLHTANAPFDPRVVWDYNNSRFIMTAEDSNLQGYEVSVSEGSSAYNSQWCDYHIPLYGSGNLDFDQLGVDLNNIYVTQDIFSSPGSGFTKSQIYALPISQLEACQQASYTIFDNVLTASGAPAFAIAPADTVGLAPAEYLVESKSSGGCSVALYTFTQTSNSQTLAVSNIGSQCYSQSGNAPQPGTPVTLMTNDSRISTTPTWVNGQLQFSLSSQYNWGGGNNDSVVAWFVLNPQNKSIPHQGLFGNPGDWFFYPAIVQTASGTAICTFDVSGSNYPVNFNYLGITPTGSLETQNGLTNNTGSYLETTGSTTRYGDYQSAFLNPTDNSKAWVVGEYPANPNEWNSVIAEVGP